VSADVVWLRDYRSSKSSDDCDSSGGEIDLVTAVDVAIRDLREILSCWGSDTARRRVEECQQTLRRAYSGATGS
jgi:hypothetical protein